MSKVAISASRLKTACDCTLRYYYNYILKLPQSQKDYFIIGTTVHLVLELLQLEKHRENFDKIIKAQDISASPSVERLVDKYIKKYESFIGTRKEDIKNFILTGVNFDLHCKGCERLLDPEYEFDIETEDYKLRGFIDASAIYSEFAYVKDYKTSKRKPPNAEKEFNIQSLIYCLVLRHNYGRFEKYVTDFVFVKFDKNPGYRCEYNNDDLDFFEFYLKNVSVYLKDFNYNNRLDAIPKGTYKSPYLCGALRGQEKVDGSPKFVCEFKYPYDYYVVYKNGKIWRTSLIREDLEKFNLQIHKKHHNGCEAWSNEIRDTI